MATDSPSNDPAPDPLKPAVRKRLDKLMEHGRQQTKQGNFDYAHDMYAGCVNKDPGNLEYVTALLANLEEKYDHNKKGGKTKGNRSDFKSAVAEEDWREVIEYGLELLQHNPWDHATLRPIAEACEALFLNEVELCYLKNALMGKPKDLEINRHCATSLARMGQFDQAIACWHRIEELSKSHKPEARKMISQLTMSKTRIATGLTEEELTGIPPSPPDEKPSSTKPSSQEQQQDPSAAATTNAGQPSAKSRGTEDSVPAAHKDPAKDSAIGLTHSADNIRTYEEAIVSDPAEISNYLKLARLYQADSDLDAAQEVLTRASSVSGNSLQVQEQLETIQLLLARRELSGAEQSLNKKPKNAKLKAEVDKQKDELNRSELDYYGRRTQRYPENNTLKYELAIRLKRAHNFAEAGKYFEEASAEAKLMPLAKLNQGECLQQTRQYRDALACYELSARKALESDQIQAYKLALYRAGMLAAGLKDADEAVRFFEELANLDREFRDVGLRLDKARKMRQN